MHVNPHTTLAQRPCTLHWQPHHTQHYTRLGPYEIAKSCHAILLSFLVRGHGGPWEIRCMTSTQAWNRTHNVKINVWQMKRWLTCCWHKAPCNGSCRPSTPSGSACALATEAAGNMGEPSR